MNILRHLQVSFGKIINSRMGLIGAVIMCTLVFTINFSHGWVLALVAGLKQAIYTFFIGGSIIRLSERIAVWSESEIKSLVLAALIPSIAAIITVYLIHQVKGTPEPIASTIPTMVLSVPGFFYIGLQKRKAHFDQSKLS